MKPIIVSGVNPILEVLKSRPSDVEEILLARKGRIVEEIIRKAAEKNIPIKKVPKEFVHRVAGHKNHQGVIARVRGFQYQDLETTIQNLKDQNAIILLLDSIEDPQNFGSIIRSSCFFGVSAIVIPEHHSVSVTDTVSRVSAGALFNISIVRVKNLVRAIDTLKKRAFLVVGLDVRADIPIYDIKAALKTALVIGNEHRGIRKRVKEHCDILVSIPRFGEMESLNAAVSAAVALSELRRKRTYHSAT